MVICGNDTGAVVKEPAKKRGATPVADAPAEEKRKRKTVKEKTEE